MAADRARQHVVHAFRKRPRAAFDDPAGECAALVITFGDRFSAAETY